SFRLGNFFPAIFRRLQGRRASDRFHPCGQCPEFHFHSDHESIHCGSDRRSPPPPRTRRRSRRSLPPLRLWLHLHHQRHHHYLHHHGHHQRRVGVPYPRQIPFQGNHRSPLRQCRSSVGQTERPDADRN